MTRILAAAFGLTLALVLPAVAHAQATPGAPLLAYQSNDQRLTLSVGAWFGKGKWRFTGPVDVNADNTLVMLDLRLKLSEQWALGLDYAGGSWRNITFNSVPAPASVSGKVSLLSVDLRRRLESQIPIDLFLGWQVYRARTDDSSVPSSDEARAGGLRFGVEALMPLRGMWSARLFLAYAPSMGVTEDFISGGTTTTTRYNGSLTDIQLAIRYDTGNRFAAEAGWRAQRIDFRRPTDILEHTLDGVFLHVIVRP